MRLFAIALLLPQILAAQSVYQIMGYETNEHIETINGYTKRWTSIYDGTNVYNASEIIQLIHPTLPLAQTNAVVESQFVWAHYDTNRQVIIETVIKFVSNPTTHIVQALIPPWPPGSYPLKPSTRIANSLVVTGTTVDRQYCRTTWRLVNPTSTYMYFQLQYSVPAPVATGNCFDSFVAASHMTNDVVCRYMDLVWLEDSSQYVATAYPDAIALGPYFTAVYPIPPFKPKYVGVSGGYFQPPIPTRKYILDYLEVDFFKPKR